LAQSQNGIVQSAKRHGVVPRPLCAICTELFTLNRPLSIAPEALVFLVFLAPCNTVKGQELSLSHLSGFWINERCDSILRFSRSPKDAFDRDDINIKFFWVTSDEIQWGIHEMNGFLVGTLTPTYVPNEFLLLDKDGNPSDHRFLFHPSDSLKRLIWIGRFQPRTSTITQSFSRLTDSIQHYCNKVIIAGQYLDSLNRPYTFTADGQAIWPNKRFRYEFGLDFIFGDPDYLINFSEFDSTQRRWVSYGFEWRRDTLLLFHQSEEADPPTLHNSREPFLILRRQ